MRKIKQIFKIQPLQIDTVELLPGCKVPGIIGAVVDVVGTTLKAKTTVVRAIGNIPLIDGIYQIKVTNTGKVTVFDMENGTSSAEYTVGEGIEIVDAVPGVKITIAKDAGATLGDIAEFEVVGDQTYIIPGTILGRIATGANAGKWRPVLSDADMSNFDCYRVASTVQETDKKKTVLPHGYEVNLSSVYTIDVIVYGQIFESVCRGINLTDAIKAKMPFIAWH